jgi:hypothetical protein
MDLQKLHEDGIISRGTLDWLLPLWQQELEDIERLREAQETANLFSTTNTESEDDYCYNQFDHSTMMITKETIQNLEGITFSFWMDVASTGHGNRVWHASIAICIYLKKQHHDHLATSLLVADGLSRLKSLELGAGTALPSLFWGHLLASSQILRPLSHQRPLIHITDGKQYRNIRQILLSLSDQHTNMVENVSLRVSPHNWGEGLNHETFKDNSNVLCQGPAENDNNPNSYDLILVSDCIYNPRFHGDLLKTIATTLRLPHATTDDDDGGGGRAILSFSLHGNVPDQDIWNFIDHTIPETRHGTWRLTARPVPKHGQHTKNRPQPVEGRYGWDMEATMKDLGLWTAHIEPKRWFSYLYEITWSKAVH